MNYIVETTTVGTFWRNEKGEYHREDGPAIEYSNDAKSWYLNGKRHRADGPAIERANGDKEWFLNGQRHRADGPAVELANGDKFWFLNGEELSEVEFNARTKVTTSLDGKEVEIDGIRYILRMV